MTIRGAAGALCCVALLAGCSSEAEPRTLPPVPSASPTPVVLPVPPEATPETAQGAAAFARYFFSEINRAYENRDSVLVRRLSTSECGSCEAVAADIDRLKKDNHSVSGQRYRLSFAEAAPADKDGRIIVDFGYEADPYVERDSDNAVVKEFPVEPPQEGQAMLIRTSGEWRVSAIRLVTS